jgi:hypothetical protein
VPVSALFQGVGNIGIGTTSPSYLLDLRQNNNGALVNIEGSSDNIAIRLKNNQTGGREYRIISTAQGSGYGTGALALEDQISGSARMVINNAGNVGIGTATPAAKLDVAGDVKASNTPKAWVSFDATRQANGSPVTGNQYLYIRSSYNVSGVFRIGGGQYQVYFTNPVTGDYCVTGTSEHYRGSNAALVYIDRVPSNGSGPIQTTYCTINTLSYNGAAYDSAAYVSVVIYGA